MTDPLKDAHPKHPPNISRKSFHIGGILCDIYGLEELQNTCKYVTCLWLLHPRGGSKERMAHFASSCISGWEQRKIQDSEIGLIAVAFDTRNHGTRLIDASTNDSWREGNSTHAQDMFSVLHGTAADTSFLIDHIGSYLFQSPNSPSIDQHMVAGVSLGGHSAWQLFFNEPRITTAIIIIGCPDYARLMSDRARLSKLETYTVANGTQFFGSRDFPNALITSVQNWDPKASLFGLSDIQANPSEPEQRRLQGLLDSKIKGKKVLVCSGKADKLVPYHCAEPFLQFLKNAAGGWYQDGKVVVEDIVFPGVGHSCTEDMVKNSARFISQLLASSGRGATAVSRI